MRRPMRWAGSIAWPWRPPNLMRGDGAAKRQGRRNGRNRLPALADAHDGDIAEVEDATENALLDVDALDLVERDLESAPFDETGLVHHAAIGDVGLGGEAVEPALDREIQRHHGDHGGRRQAQYGHWRGSKAGG